MTLKIKLLVCDAETEQIMVQDEAKNFESLEEKLGKMEEFVKTHFIECEQCGGICDRECDNCETCGTSPREKVDEEIEN